MNSPTDSAASVDGPEEVEYRPEGRPGSVQRRLTRDDAHSILGGERFHYDKKAKSKTEADTSVEEPKVFSFSLPFGGLSLLRTGLKFPSLPFGLKEDPEVEELRLKLQRHNTLTTVEELRVFAKVRGLEDVRLKAVKNSIRDNLHEILPDFVHRRKDELVFADIDGPIVVMGGYRGLILRDAHTGKRVWIPLKAGFHLRKIDLLLGPTREDELKARDTIYPDGMLKNIGPIDLCKRFIKKLDLYPGNTVREFGYDWRLSLDITRDELIEFLEALREETGKTPLVIAHSMGGLVAHGAVQKRPELFRGLIYAGVPSECLNILGPVRYGDSVLFSDKILTFESNFMMRLSFYFLPLSGRVFGNREKNEWYDLDYMDPETWVKYNLNPLVAERRREEELLGKEKFVVDDHSLSTISVLSGRLGKLLSGSILRNKPAILTNDQMQKKFRSERGSTPTSPPPEEDPLATFPYFITFSEAYDYLCDLLKRAKAYMLGLEYDPELKHRYPPMAVVYGDSVPSVRGSNVRGYQDIRDGHYYEFFYGPGDGVVNCRWLMPERKGFQMHDSKSGEGHIVGRFPTSMGHVNILTDLKAMEKAVGLILEAEKTWLRQLHA